MRQKNIFIVSALALLAGFTACEDNDLDKNSIFKDDVSLTVSNKFDRWIDTAYIATYNIDLIYKFSNIEADHEYNLSPADLTKAEKLAMSVKYCWLEAYDEVAGIDFTRQYAPKVLQMIGSSAYNNNNTEVLGTAEGGIKVTLYKTNFFKLDRDILNEYFFKTMHHEFAHILHQTKDYDPNYQRISQGKYVSGDWYTFSDTDALTSGFITPYAMSEAREDIAEMTAMYITQTPAEWAARIKTAGTEGAPIIERKLEIVKKYMKDSWNIDLDQLRDVVQARMDDILSEKIDLEAFVNSLNN